MKFTNDELLILMDLVRKRYYYEQGLLCEAMRSEEECVSGIRQLRKVVKSLDVLHAKLADLCKDAL